MLTTLVVWWKIPLRAVSGETWIILSSSRYSGRLLRSSSPSSSLGDGFGEPIEKIFSSAGRLLEKYIRQHYPVCRDEAQLVPPMVLVL